MKMVGISDGSPFYAPLLLAGLFFFAIKLLVTDHTVLEWIAIIALLGLSTVIYIRTKEKGFLLCMTLLLGVKGLSIRSIYKFGCVIGSAGMFVMIFLSVFGFIHERLFWGRRPVISMQIMHSLGYVDKNSAMITYVALIMMLLYLTGNQSKKRTIRLSLLALCGAFYLFFYDISRTGMVIAVLYLSLNYYFQFLCRFHKAEAFVGQLVLPVCVALQTVVPGFVDFALEQSSTAMHRFGIAHYYLTENPISFLGHPVNNPLNYWADMDMSIANLLVHQGLLALIIYFVLYFMFIRYSYREKRRGELALVLSMLIYSNMEPFLFNLSYKNVSLLLIGFFLLEKEEGLLQTLPAFFSNRVSIRLLFLRGAGAKASQEYTSAHRLKKQTGERIIVSERKASAQRDQEQRTTKKNRLSVFYSRHPHAGLILAIGMTTLVLVCSALSISRPMSAFIDVDPDALLEDDTEYYFSDNSVHFGYSHGSVIINYSGNDTPMYKTKPEISRVEIARKLVSTALFTFVITEGVLYCTGYRSKWLTS